MYPRIIQEGKHFSIDALTSPTGSCPSYFSFSGIATQKFAKKKNEIPLSYRRGYGKFSAWLRKKKVNQSNYRSRQALRVPGG